jgi:hypothetical protein
VGRHGEGGNNSDQKCDGEKLLAKSEHAWVSLDGLNAFMRKGTRAKRARQYAKFPSRYLRIVLNDIVAAVDFSKIERYP